MRRAILILTLTLAACGEADYSDEVAEILAPARCELGAQVLCFDFSLTCRDRARRCLEISQACMTEAAPRDEACVRGAACPAECWAVGYGCMADDANNEAHTRACQAATQDCVLACPEVEASTGG